MNTLTDLDLARLPRVWMVLEMSVSVRDVQGSFTQTTRDNRDKNQASDEDEELRECVWSVLYTHRVMRSQVEEARGQDRRSKEAEEDETTDGRVANIRVD